MENKVLLRNKFLSIPKMEKNNVGVRALGTVLSNFAHYGYVPDKNALLKMVEMNDEQLGQFWTELEPAIKEVTGSDRNMEQHVVYKNFPKEVLDMSQAEYWTKQILMYWGFPNDLFTQKPLPREKMDEKISLKVLRLANESTLDEILDGLVKSTARWTDAQTEDAKFINEKLARFDKSIELSSFGFKENAIIIAKETFLKAGSIVTNSATDVLRLAAFLSDGKPDLKENVRFARFNRSSRKELLSMLDGCPNLEEDCARHPEVWKRLFNNLHPGDYKFQSPIAVYNKLYNSEQKSYAALVEAGLSNKDNTVLDLLKQRPGEFLRKFHQSYELFGKEAVSAFTDVFDSLTNNQLLKLEKYILTINDRKSLIVPPKGNWTKAKILQNDKVKFESDDIVALQSAVANVVGKRLEKQFPEGIQLAQSLETVKLQTNDQKLSEYGRGTEFDIPKDVEFLRTATYWEHKERSSSVFFDNGWNFFDKDWTPKGAVCWNSTVQGTVFSGDPTNIKDLHGKACQMIDLDLKELEKNGVQYAVWNVLSFNSIKFSDATDVLATLQWGVDPQKGNLYEPSRAQIVFPLKDESLTKYVACMDIPNRKLVYIDVNFKASTQSAIENGKTLNTVMPAFVEYLRTIPSVHDLFKYAPEGKTPVVYTDKDVEISSGNAYVFKKENTSNSYDEISLTHLLDDNSTTQVAKKKKKSP